MRSRLLTLLVMLLVAAALVVYGQREDRLNAPVVGSGLLYPGLDVGQIHRLYLGLERGQYVEFERDAGGLWRIIAPAPEYARQDYVDVVLDNLARAQAEPAEVEGRPVRPENVGLEPPKYQIRFTDSRHANTLLLGEVEPLGRMVYAHRQGDERVVLATRNLITLLKQHGQDFVDPALVRGLRGDVIGIRLTGPGGVELDAERVGDEWILSLPDNVLADDDRVTTLIRSLRFAQAERVLKSQPSDTDLRAFGLPDADERASGELAASTLLEIRAKGESPVRIWLAAGWRNAGDRVAVLREDIHKIVGVPAEALGVLGNDAEWFRARRVLPPIRERATSLRFVADGEELLNVRAGRDGRWSFVAPERLAGEPVASERYFGHSVLAEFLGLVDAIEVLDFAPAPTGEPWARLFVGWTRAGQPRQDTIDVFAPMGDRILVRSSERPAEGLLLSRDAVESLLDPVQADLLQDVAPLDVDSGRWTAFEIDHAALVAPLRIERPSGQGAWEGDDPWGRRFGVATNVMRSFRGMAWRPARAGVRYPWAVRFLGAGDVVLAQVRLRSPGDEDEREAYGEPAAYAAVSGHDGIELLVSHAWIDALAPLNAAQLREP